MPRKPASLEINEALLRFGSTDRRDLVLRDVVVDHINRVLDACGGSRTMAAVLLGIPRRSLQRKLQRMSVKRGKR